MSKLIHNMSIKDAEEEFGVNTQIGLEYDRVETLRQQYGHNQLASKKGKSLFQMFISEFKDFMVIILIVAAMISVFLGEIADAAVIFAVVILNAVLGTIQESKAEKSLEALKKLSAPAAKVKRNGVIQTVQASEIVPGDIVILEAGDFVPADGRIIDSASLKVEESALTGESAPVEKNSKTIEKEDLAVADRINMLYSSSIVTYGRGSMIATGTGMNTEIGKIANLIMQEDNSITPLQRKLEEIGKMLGIVALIICGVIFGLGVYEGKNALEMFMTAVSLAVAAIPEGLPAIVTIVLAIGVQRMVKRNAVIRKLPAVETLGSASVICSDKTGTLTQNKMTVQLIETVDSTWNINDSERKVNSDIELALKGITLCNDSRISKIENEWHAVGDPTETALVMVAAENNIIKNELEEIHPRGAEIPFDSDRKLMTTINKIEGGYRVFVKGAPDVLISRCTKAQKGQAVIDISEDIIKNIEEKNLKMGQKALRVLGLAYKDVEVIPAELHSDIVENNLTFVSLVGMIDPPRTEVKDSIRIAREAGIRTVMITGDHSNTATAIAKQLGIVENETEVMTGAQLNKLTQEQLNECVEKYSVYARVSPEHKVMIVKAWQSIGRIVAMTGDGVNDAPALKKADIGAAMGLVGTDVARDAADMVLTDDNFTTIVSAVEEGRGIYSNIIKSIHYLLSSNIGEIIIIFVAILLNLPSPLLPIHILWVNLVTDSLPALALGMEPVEKDIMKRKPRDPKKSMFANGIGLRIGFEGLMIGLITFFVFYYDLKTFNKQTATTMAFLTLSLTQLVHSMNTRSSKSVFSVGLFKNRYLIGAILVSALLQLSVIFIPQLRQIFKVVPLSIEQWQIVVIASFLPLIIVEIVKLSGKLFNRVEE